MPDVTAQPVGDKGVNPLYGTATFLWNAAVPGKNQITGATTTPKGTNSTGAAGKFQHMSNTDGSFSFPVAKPVGEYTLVLVLCHPTAGVSSVAKILSMTGGGVRLETYTSGGGVYHNYTHTGAASATGVVSGVAGFNTNMWVHVTAYTGTQLRTYLKKGDGTNVATTTQTIAYSAGGAATLAIGDDTGVPGQAIYAALLIPSDIGDVECIALRDNPWRMFTDATVLAWTGTVTGQSGTVGAAISALATASFVSGGTAPYAYSATGIPPGLSINASTGSITGTPTTAGSYSATVSVTDSAGSPATVSSAAFAWTVSAAPATATTLSGPSGGTVGFASSNFTVGANGAITGTVTVTPSDGGGGGTFSQTSVEINSGTPTATFTYTPGSTGAKTISISDTGSLTDATPLTYTATLTPGTITVSNIRNGSGALLASTTFPNVVVVQRSTRAVLLALTAQTTSGAGALSITNGALPPGTACIVLAFSDDGTQAGAWPATAV